MRALALMGSYARGEAGPYSDVDVVRFIDSTGQDPAGEVSSLQEGHLVVVSTVTPPQVEEWFSEPEKAVNVTKGVSDEIAHPESVTGSRGLFRGDPGAGGGIRVGQSHAGARQSLGPATQGAVWSAGSKRCTRVWKGNCGAEPTQAVC